MSDPTRDDRARRAPALHAPGATSGTLTRCATGGKRPGRNAAVALLIFLAAAAVYANTLRNEFVTDDQWIIIKNPMIQDLSKIPKLFAVNYWHGYIESNLYRPVTVASFALNHAVGGLNPAGYHAVSILLHALCSVLVLLLARRFWPSGPGAIAAGLVFALHPVHTEAVAAAFGRSELLAAAGVLGVLVLHTGDYRAWFLPRPAVIAVSVFLFALAALAKESAFVLPALLVIADMATGRRPLSRLREYAPYAAVALALLGVRAVVLAGPRAPVVFADNPLAPAPLAVRWLTAIAILGRYIALLVWPVRLSADYTYAAILPISRVFDAAFLLGVLAIVAFAALGFRFRRARGVAFAAALFFIAIAPTSNLLITTGTIMAERLLYLPSVSICLLAGAALSGFRLREGSARRWALPALAVLVCAFFAARTVVRNRDWRTNRALFESALRVVPNSFRVHSVLGEILMEEGKYAEARAHLERAIAIWPKWPDTLWRLGAVTRRLGDVAAAQPHFREALRLDPRHRDALFSLAESEQQLGRLEAAVSGYVMLESIETCYPGLQQNLGYALRDLGRLADAESAFRRGLACAPDSAGPYRGLATVLEERGDRAGAKAAYRAALARDSTDAITANNLAWLLAEDGRPDDEALALAERALRLQPDATVYDTIAWIRYRRGDLAGAVAAIREAARLDSASAEIRGRREIIEAAWNRAGGQERGSS